MYQHRVWADQLVYHQLQGANSYLRLVPARGGIITEWVIAGEPVLFLDPATLLDTTKNVRGGIPILFPVCGPLRDDQYSWEGQTYSMKQHGFARNLPWQVTKVETATDSASITLETSSNQATLKVFPFNFRLIFTYQFSGTSLTIRQIYQHTIGMQLPNQASQTCCAQASGEQHSRADRMPFYAGFHPYFYAPDRQALKLDIPAQTCQEILTGSTEAFSGNLCLSEVAEANYVLKKLNNNQVTFSNFGSGRKIVLDSAEQFKYIVLWALGNQNFFCVEPWMADNYALNTGQDLQFLDPGEQMETWVSISVQ